MPRYKTPEGIVVELDEGYAQTLPSLFEPVSPDTPLSPRECCGGTGWIVNGRVVHRRPCQLQGGEQPWQLAPEPR